MPRYADFVEAPYQGLSSAPPQVRLATQAERLDNCNISIPGGLTPRPPFEWLASLGGITPGGCKATYIPKGGVGNFILTVTDEEGEITPSLYEAPTDPLTSALSPTAVTISPEAQAYLDEGSPDPTSDIELLTVEDTTFILNRKVEVGLTGDIKAARPPEAMLWVRQAAYARKYVVTIRHGTGKASTLTVTLETPNGKDATDGEDVDTGVIAEGLVSGTYPISSTGGTNGASVTNDLDSLTGSGFTVSRVADVIYLSHATLDFDVEVADGQGGDALLAIKDRVQSFSDLPKRAPVNGFTVRATQQTGTDQDDFFLEFSQTAGAGTGVWTETLAPGAGTGLDPETLPVGLVYDRGTETWSLDVLDWKERLAGDDTLNPDPGFVGVTLEDISFWRGRLYLLYAEGARASSATDPLTLYPTTMTQVLADDAFEIINPLTRQAQFRYMVPFKKKLILFGSEAQAQISAPPGSVTAETVEVAPFAEHEFSSGVRPQGSNDRIYFAASRGESSSAVLELEITRASTEDNAEADEMTAHVPRFLPPALDRAATCLVNYTTVWARSGDPDLRVHYYRYSERQRVQNAWLPWQLPVGCTLEDMFFVNTRLYALLARGEAIHLLRLDVADGVTDPGARWRFHVDYKLHEDSFTKTYLPDSDTTQVVLPYAPRSEPRVIVTHPGGTGGPAIFEVPLEAPEGTTVEVASWSASSATITLTGDWTQAPLIIGEAYSAECRLSRVYYRDAEGKPRRDGRFVIRKLALDLAGAALLKVRVTSGGREPDYHLFEASLLDSPNADYDELNLYEGEWEVHIGSPANEVEIDLIMDTGLPSAILGWTWIGEFNPRSRVAR